MTDPMTLATRNLIIEALQAAPDADTSDPDFHTMFTPSSHREALAPDATVVKGARGTGKTYWAKALADPALREVAARSYLMPRLSRTEVVTAFGSAGGDEPVFPGKRAIEGLVQEFGKEDKLGARDLWSAVVLMALKVPQVIALDSWIERIRWTARNGEAYESAVRRADRETREQGKTLILLFDQLDRLHSKRAQIDLLLSGLLEVALELRLTTTALRAKIFVRPDLYESAPRNFADASKLDANAADLSWSRENLYGLFFHQLGNHASEAARAFRDSTEGDWRAEEGGRYIAPVEVLADQKAQERLFVTLAGPFMGTDRRKGHTYTWLPNHLQDGLGRISPRTLLSTLRKAAERTDSADATHPLPLYYEAIRESLSHAASVRVQELKDDLAWAALAVELLAGSQVPMEPSAVQYAWNTRGFSARLREVLERETAGGGPRDAGDPVALLGELEKLGVITYRTNGAVDLPDIYRLAFDIGRKGGVKRSTSPS
ncbi:hypothetical protein [Streptomyces montanisoli]|uniref:Uncharacterized protein n=1 Tax=Streptomyces montanisoli TaxID=2798581 RepID=A0A940MDE0_9ACTN|nr:hypothetical protein [Streptomyces montanisoli]MBP0458321.1 hypothetical protein [Streptomyces montanisoli]